MGQVRGAPITIWASDTVLVLFAVFIGPMLPSRSR